MINTPASESDTMIDEPPPESRKDDLPISSTRTAGMEVNTQSVRNCLNIATLVTRTEIPPCFTVQMMFTELILRDFASVSLPVFVREVRPVVKDIYRSSSQPPTPENVTKSVNLLWAGLSVALWETKMNQIAGHFQKVTAGNIADLRISLTKAHFEGLKSSPLPPIPPRVISLLRALSVLAAGDGDDSKPLEIVVSSLGLNIPSSMKRVKIFDQLQHIKANWSALPIASRTWLSQCVDHAELTSLIPPELELNFSFTILRDTLIAVLNIIDFDLRKYVQRTDLLSGEAVKVLQKNISTALSRAEDRSVHGVVKSGKPNDLIAQSAIAWICENLQNDEDNARFRYLLQHHGADTARCHKASKDCDMLASCPRPTRLRWYIEPKSLWCDMDNERYTFVAETDLAFEYLYIESQDVSVDQLDTLEVMLVRRALTAWFTSENPEKAEKVSLSSSISSKVAFGVNYRFVGHPLLFLEGFPSLRRILGYPHIDRFVIGCSDVRPDSSRVVTLRCFVQENYAQQQGWSMAAYLQSLQQPSDAQRRLIGFGALPLVRLMALRDQHSREPVVSLSRTIHVGPSEAHKALEAVFRSAGRYQRLVLSPSVAHTVLDLIVCRRVGVKYGCDFLCNLRTFVEETPTDVVASLMNQRFERLQDEYANELPPEPDLYDILWLLASRPDVFSSEWSSIAHDIARFVFFAKDIQNDVRIFQYSHLVSLGEMMLERDSSDRIVVVRAYEGEVLKGGRLPFFQRIPRMGAMISRLLLSPDPNIIANESKLYASVSRVRSAEAVRTTVEELLARYFAVVRTEYGLFSLGIDDEILSLIIDMLEERYFSSSMSMLAAEHVHVVACLCTRNSEFLSQVIKVQFVEAVVETAWSVQSKETSAVLIHALAEFVVNEVFQRQVVFSLSRVLEPPLHHQGTSLVQNFIPTVLINKDELYSERVRRFKQIVSDQYQVQTVCSCVRSIPIEDMRLTVQKTAVKMVVAILDRVVTRISCGGNDQYQYPITTSTRFRKAMQIQRNVLKWLYSSRRRRRIHLRVTTSSSTCKVCNVYPSFVSGVLLFLNTLDGETAERSAENAQDIVVILRCVNVLVQYPPLSLLLASDFRLHHALLTLASHRSQRIRSLALSSLAELSWHSPGAFKFTCSRLSKLLWRNYAVALQKGDPQYCSWVEHAVHFAVGTMSTVSIFSESSKSTVDRDDQLIERDSVASMLAILSFSDQYSDLILRITPILTKTMRKWIHDSTPCIQVKLLVAIQNAIIRTPTLTSMSEMALKMYDDFYSILSAKFANNAITRSLAYGIMWILCTQGHIRARVVIQVPDSVANIDEHSDLPALAELLNALGLISTVSVDCAVGSVCERFLEQLWQVYSRLYTLCSTTTSVSAPHSSSTPQSLWVRQHARFNLLPEIGTLNCLSSRSVLANRVLDQIFRFYCVVSSCRVYQDSVTGLAVKFYVKTFGYQVWRGGPSAEFALETLTQVFRAVNAVQGADAQRKKANSVEDLMKKARQATMSDDEAAAIVNVLGGIIGEPSSPVQTADHTSGRTKMEISRRVILALWGLQVVSHRAQSLSRSMTHRLVELMHDVEADNDLRIAILGLLVKMYRAQPQSNNDRENLPVVDSVSISDEIQSRVLRVVMNEVPLIIGILRPYAENGDVATMLHTTDAWSPLYLDKDATSTALENTKRLEVLTNVRWLLEVLSLLSGSIFFEKIHVSQEYNDVLIKLLLLLDTSSTRAMFIQGRDEVVIGIATVLRAFSKQTPLTNNQTKLCVHALFDSEPMMTYASDLAAICHTSIQAADSFFDVFGHQEHYLLVASLRFIQSGDLRLELLCNCLDMITTIAATLGETAFMNQISHYEQNFGSATTALFGQMTKIFQGTMRSMNHWVICRKGIKLFRQLLMWQSFFDHFIRAKHVDREPFQVSVRSTTAVLSASYRPSPYRLDDTMRSALRIVLLLVNFKYWCDEVPSASHLDVLLSSVDANAIVIRLLRDFGDDSRETATLLSLANETYSPSCLHRVCTLDNVRDPLEKLLGVISSTFSFARNNFRVSFHSHELYERIYQATLSSLVLATSLHRARHTLCISRFFVQNYAFPIFAEENLHHIAKLVRLYRQCCCNAYVYRIIRLGKKSLWSESAETEDLSFFRKLGTVYHSTIVDTGNTTEDIIQLRFDLLMFLEQQDFSFLSMPAEISVPTDSNTDHVGQDMVALQPADEATSQVCLRDHFATTLRDNSVTYAVQEFEVGLISADHSGGVRGVALCNELINAVTHALTVKPSLGSVNYRSLNGSQDISALLAIVSRLINALERSGAQVISETSLTRILHVLETSFLRTDELNALLELLPHPLSSYFKSAEVFRSITARLGHTGIRDFGFESCFSSLVYLDKWVTITSTDIPSLLSVVPFWVDRIVETMSVYSFGKDCAELAEHAFMCFLAVTSSASETQLRWILQTLAAWQPANQPPSMVKRPSQIFDTAWQVFFQFLYEKEARLRSAFFRLMHGFVVAQPEVSSELVKHNVIPFVVDLLHDPDRETANNALCLLHRISSSSPGAANVLSAFLQSGIPQPSYNGPLTPLRVDFNGEAQTERRDHLQIANILARQPMCSAMTPLEILKLASTVSIARFQPGEQISIASSTSPTIPLVVASGVVEWRFDVCRKKGEPVFSESARLGKNALLGARSVFVVRNSIRDDVMETAVAVNDVVCLVVNESCSASSATGIKTSNSIAKASGAWHRWLRPRHQEKAMSHVKHLVNFASGDFGSDEVVQRQAADLLRAVLSYISNEELNVNDAYQHKTWVDFLVVPLLQRPAVPRSLRLQILRLIVCRSAQSPRRGSCTQHLVSLGRCGRLDGLVVLGRAFRLCSTDSECRSAWFRSVLLVVFDVEDDEGVMRRAKALVGAMSDGALLRIVGACVTVPYATSDTKTSPVNEDSWRVLLLVCKIRHRSLRLIRALTEMERTTLARNLVGLLENSNNDQDFLALFSAITSSPEFCVSLWCTQPTNRLLYLLESSISSPDCSFVSTLNALRVLTNSLKVRGTSVVVRFDILKCLHSTCSKWSLRLASSAMENEDADKSLRADMISFMNELVYVMEWSRKCSNETSIGVMVDDIIQTIVRARWIRTICQKLVYATAESSRVRQKWISSLRILNDSRYHSVGDAEDSVLCVNLLHNMRDKTGRRPPQCDPVIVTAVALSSLLDVSTLSVSIPSDLQSVEAFTRANIEVMKEMIHDRRQLGPLVRRLLLFRGICSISTRDSSHDNDQEIVNVVAWLMRLIGQSTCIAQIRRIGAACVLHLIHRDAGVRKYLFSDGIDRVVPQLFESIEAKGARKSRVSLLWEICSCLPSHHDFGTEEMRVHASRWTGSIVRLTLECDNLQLMHVLVSIAQWLLDSFSTWSFETATVNVELYIQRVLTTLVSTSSPEASLSFPLQATRDGIAVISKILTLHTVIVGDMVVLSRFIHLTLVWIAKASGTATPSEKRDSLIFCCISAILQLANDQRYSKETNAILRSDGIGLLNSCKAILADLGQFELFQRCVLLDVVLLEMRVLDHPQKSEAQMLLYSAWEQKHGWWCSLKSDHLGEQSNATALVRLMCADNADLTERCVRQQESLILILQNNLHRCNEAFVELDILKSKVLSLLYHTSALLCRLVRALAEIRMPMNPILFDEVLSTVGSFHLLCSDDAPLRLHEANAVIHVCRLLKSCLKYHIGFCRRLLHGRCNIVVAKVLHCLVSLLRNPTTFNTCVDTTVWLTRALHGQLRSEDDVVPVENFTDILVHLITNIASTLATQATNDKSSVSRGTIGLLQSLHALVVLAPVAANETAATLLNQRGIPETLLQVFLDLYPSFVTHVSQHVVVQLVNLSLDTAVDSSISVQVSVSVLQVMKDAVDDCTDKEKPHNVRARGLEHCCHLIIVGNLLCRAVLVSPQWDQSQSHALAPSVLATTVRCLQRCLLSRQTYLMNKVAVAGAEFMKVFYSSNASGLDLEASTASFCSLLDVLETELTWQLAWFTTSVVQSIRGGGHVLSAHITTIGSILPRLIETTWTALSINHCQACFYLLGLVVECAQALLRGGECDVHFIPFDRLRMLIVRALHIGTRTSELSTLTLVCWSLFRRFGKHVRSVPIESENEASIWNPTSRIFSQETTSELVIASALLVRDQVEALCDVTTEALPKGSIPIEKLWETATHGHTCGPHETVEYVPVLNLLECVSEARAIVTTWISLQIVDHLMTDDEETTGRLFAECTRVVADTARLFTSYEALPSALLLISLRLVARSMKSFRLFLSPVVDEVDITSVCRLVQFNDVSVSILAMQTLWQILRNRRICHRFAACVQPIPPEHYMDSISSSVAKRTIEHCKELVYTDELDTRRLEAAFGILVQLAKIHDALDVILVMDELHPNAIFLDDPHSLFSALLPSRSSKVLLQQCKLLKHVSRWRPTFVLEKTSAMKCLSMAITQAVSYDQLVEASFASVVIVAGEGLLFLISVCRELPTSYSECLRDILTADDCAVLQACYRILCNVLQHLEVTEKVEDPSAPLVREFGYYSSMLFYLTSTKHTLCLQTEIVNRLVMVPKTLLGALKWLRAYIQQSTTNADDPLYPLAQLQLQLLRTLRRITVVPSIILEFRAKDPSLLDLLVEQLRFTKFIMTGTRDQQASAYDRELLLITLHITRDPVVSSIVATRLDIHSSLFQFNNQAAPASLLVLFWQVLHNVVEHSDQITDVMLLLATKEYVAVLAQQVAWNGPERLQLARVATSTLRAITDKVSVVHPLILKYAVVFATLLSAVPAGSMSSPNPTSLALVLENIAHILAGAMHACSKDINEFCGVLELIEQLVSVCNIEAEEPNVPNPHLDRTKSLYSTWTTGVRGGIERLVCALCELLLSFHEVETNISLSPGYEIRRADVPSDSSLTTGSDPRDKELQRASARTTRTPLGHSYLRVRSKTNGVYCLGISPASSEVLDRILRIFACVCTLQKPWLQQRRQKRHGRSVGVDIATLGGNFLIHVVNFFFQAAHTPSGRFFFLNPNVIQFWFQLLPQMNLRSLQTLCDGIVRCTLAKEQTLGFLSSGGLRLLVSVTCKIVREASMQHDRELEHASLDRTNNAATNASVVIGGAFQQFIVAAAVMTERAPFLQSTFYLVHAGEVSQITVAGLVLASIMYSSGNSTYLKLACKVLSRFFALFTLDETQNFLATCPAQIARVFEWRHIDENHVMMALITMVELTESEAIMKHRVLVNITHGTLMRTAVLGLIDKGIPEVLHDFGLKTMMISMQSVQDACHEVNVICQEIEQAQALSNSTDRRQDSMSTTAKTSVEKMAAGLTGAALTAGIALLGTPTVDGSDADDDIDPRMRLSKRLEHCIDAFTDVINEIGEYTMTGYRDVFKNFENWNEDLELIAAMESSSYAIALKQATFYAIEIVQEALVAALSDMDTQANSLDKVPTTQPNHPTNQKNEKQLLDMDRDTAVTEAAVFFQTLESVLELITVSLQHNDMDILFYGHKFQQLGRYVEALLRFPITDEDHETGVYTHTDVGHPEDDSREFTKIAHPQHRSRRPSIDFIRRNRASESSHVYLQFRSIELRSWLWSVLGLLPYLRVRYDENVFLVRFQKTKYSENNEARPPVDGSHEYACSFEVKKPARDHVEVPFRELPRAIDVEVWVYIPFWYQDVRVSHAKVPILAQSLKTDSFNFQFYPEGTHGAQAHRPEVVATVTMVLSDQSSEPKGDLVPAEELISFPAYSTFGSRTLRRFLRYVARVTRLTKLIDVISSVSRRRRILGVVALKGRLDSLENDRQLETMTAQQVVAYLVTKAIGVLREATHPDKLVAPSVAAACDPLVTKLEQKSSVFAQILTNAFETKNTRMWLEVEKALHVVQHLFLEKGLTLFTEQYQHQPQRTNLPQKRASIESPAVHPLSPTTLRKQSREKQISSLFAGMTACPSTPKKPLRDVASQLRHVHLREHYDYLDDEGDRSEVFLSRSTGFSIPSARLLQGATKRSAHLSDGRQSRVSPAAAAYLHQHAASKSEWRMIYPHVSLWSLSPPREPLWHSFERMAAPTSLNHFLLQPVNRLQVYCAVLEFLQSNVQRDFANRVKMDMESNLTLSSCSSSALDSTTGRKSPISGANLGETKEKSHDREEILSTLPAKESLKRGPTHSPSTVALMQRKTTHGILAIWKSFFRRSGQVGGLAIVQKALAGTPGFTDFRQLEGVRARRLLKYHAMDPFDAAARLQRLYQHASRLPQRLYREGPIATLVYIMVWLLLGLTVWRVSIARDAVHDSEQSFQELFASQSSGKHDHISKRQNQRPAGETSETVQIRTRRIVISDRQPRHHQTITDTAIASVTRTRKHQVAPSSATVNAESSGRDLASPTSPQIIVLSEQELKHLVILLELKRLISDIVCVWPTENGNIGLNGFWSSLWFTGIALGCPLVLVYAVFPLILRYDPSLVRYLSYVACLYGTCWIVAAYFSIRGVTKKIPAFREVRHVEHINLTDFPYSLRNYMAIGSVIWDGFQLNTTSFSVWKMSYKPKQLVALTTIDLQDIGLGSLEVNVFRSKQMLSFVCLLVWFICLKASNKFKSMQFLNYLITFLLPNLLGGMLFMFLSKQFYQTAACFQDPTTNATVLWANKDIECWTNDVHITFALRGLFGMSLFVPLAVLAYGSYQVFFPEVNLDVQTSPLLNVSAQIVKAAMMGALTFFVNQVQLFLAVALVGNLLLLFLVTKYDLCSTWHLKYGKVLIYAMSSWSALCAMISTFFSEQERDLLPMYTMHGGWGTLVLLGIAQVYRRFGKERKRKLLESNRAAHGRRVLVKQQTQRMLTWRTKANLPTSANPLTASQPTMSLLPPTSVPATQQ